MSVLLYGVMEPRKTKLELVESTDWKALHEAVVELKRRLVQAENDYCAEHKEVERWQTCWEQLKKEMEEPSGLSSPRSVRLWILEIIESLERGE